MTKETEVPVRLARLTKPQREFIKTRCFREMIDKLNKKIELHPSKEYTSFTNKDYRFLGVSAYNGKLEVRNDGYLDTCVDVKEVATRIRNTTELPNSWYREQYDAGKFKVETEMPDCAIRPKMKLVFTNEARDLKAAQTKAYNNAMRRIKKMHKSRVVLRDELRVDCMELNKWVYNVLEPELMLTMDGANALERIMKLMPKPL